jgi:hypothetical protein
VGARRGRQGLGPFVAGHLTSLGARVPCFLATCPETRDSAARILAEDHGVEARGYCGLDALLCRERIDALAILSPSETHEHYLELALEARLHVLCEKPLIWGVPELAQRARELVERFAAANLLLRENCQWPFTLEGFAKLHPGVLEAPLRSFAMCLSPISGGLTMLVDSLSHPLSVLQTLAPHADSHVEDPRFEVRRGGDAITVRFRYAGPGEPVEVEVLLERSERFPREASYAVNGHRVDRRIRASDYAHFLVAGERSVELLDPLRELLRVFLYDLSFVLTGAAKPAKSTVIPQRMAMFEDVVQAFRSELGS